MLVRLACDPTHLPGRTPCVLDFFGGYSESSCETKQGKHSQCKVGSEQRRGRNSKIRMAKPIFGQPLHKAFCRLRVCLGLVLATLASSPTESLSGPFDQSIFNSKANEPIVQANTSLFGYRLLQKQRQRPATSKPRQRKNGSPTTACKTIKKDRNSCNKKTGKSKLLERIQELVRRERERKPGVVRRVHAA